MDLTRTPPYNNETEQSVLGAMLIKKECISLASELLEAEDFYRDSHKKTFQTIVDMFNANKSVDIVTIVEELKKNNDLEQVGGIAYITSLANSVPTTANTSSYCKIVKEKATLRKLINGASHIASTAYDASDDLPNILDEAERTLFEVLKNRTVKNNFLTKDLTTDALLRIKARANSAQGIVGLPTGFKDIDWMTKGLREGQFIVLAARPAMGKTGKALNIAANVAIRQKKAVAFFSLEMPKEEVMDRLLCTEARINIRTFADGNLEAEEWRKICAASDKLSEAPLVINDAGDLTIAELRSQARRLKIEHDVQLIIIDYLQLMAGGYNKNRKPENRQQEISDICRGIKSLAKELGIPIIALSQLSRSVEARQDKRPMLADLRESGAIEQDADIVLFLYRDDYYNKESEKPNITEVSFAKHRNGPVGTVELYFQKELILFRDYMPEAEYEAWKSSLATAKKEVAATKIDENYYEDMLFDGLNKE